MRDPSLEIQGRQVRRGEPAYESLRQSMIWNGRKPARYPDLIVQAASAADVLKVVELARREKTKIAIRGGGHSWCAASMRDGGILLDLSRLADVEIDAATRIARVQPAAQNADLARKLGEHELAFPLGHCSDVPLSGYVLGGGFGWNVGQWGMACFNVAAIEMVTADARAITASATENPELFWAARGAGAGFFGVVTRYHLKCQPLPKRIKSSTLVFPIAALTELSRWAQTTVSNMPRNVEMILILSPAPPPFADRCSTVAIVGATVFADTDEEAARALAPMASCPVEGCLSKDLGVSTPFEALFAMMDGIFVKGRRYAADSLWLAGELDALIGTAASCYEHAPSPESVIMAPVLPASAEPPQLPDCAFSMVAPAILLCYAIWEDPAKDEENVRWLRSTTAALESSTVGHYVGEADFAVEGRARRSFAKDNWQRLQQLNAKYDPDGIFHGFPEEG